MSAALHAEWTKLRTLRSTTGSLLGVFGFMVGLAAIVGHLSNTDASRAGQGDRDVVQLALFGFLFAQIAAATLGVSVISSEYAAETIRTTFAAVPRRGAVLAAKAAVLVGAVFPVALIASAVAFVVAQPSLHAAGYVAPAYPAVSLGNPGALRAIIGTGLLLTAYALLALGIGAIMRHSGAAIAFVVGLLLIPFITVTWLPPGLGRWLEQATPLAGLSIQSTTGQMLGMLGGNKLGALPLGTWGGLAVSFAWAAAALLVAYVLIRSRDT